MEGLTDVPAKWITPEGIRKGIDTICVEEALSISVSNGSDINFSLGVTMRTPGDDIHLVSLARNLRILGNWISLYRSGKPHYLKKFRKNTWLQILKHVEHLRLWDLRELFQEIYYKTK